MPNNIEATATPNSLVTKLGDNVETNLHLRNLGQTIDQLTISIEGLDANWYAIPVSSVALFPNDEDNLKIIFEPPKADQIKAGVYNFCINVSSQTNPEEINTVDMSIEVQTVPELEINISPQSITGRRGIYHLGINNPGDNEATIQLQCSDSNGALKYYLQSEYLTIPPNRHSEVSVEVSLGWLSFFGGAKDFSFQVLAIQPEDDEGKIVEGKLSRIAWHRMISQIKLPRLKLPRILSSLLQKPPEITVFEAKSDDKIEFRLTWSVKRSKDIKLNNASVEQQGDRLVSPSASTSYLLTASNKYGSSQKTIEVDPRLISKAKTSERIRATLSSSDLTCQAGGTPEIIMVQLQNLGETVDKFMVEVEGLDEAWYSRSASSIALMPQAVEQVQISFHPPKTRGRTRPRSKPGQELAAAVPR